MTSLLTVENLRITAPDGRVVLDEVNLELRSGRRMAIMGRHRSREDDTPACPPR